MSPKVPQFDDFVDKGVELETPPNRSRRHNAASSATITDTIGSKQAQPRSSSTCLSEQWDDSFHSLSASLSTLDLDGSSPTSTAGGESPTSNHGLLNSSSRRLQRTRALEQNQAHHGFGFLGWHLPVIITFKMSILFELFALQLDVFSHQGHLICHLDAVAGGCARISAAQFLAGANATAAAVFPFAHVVAGAASELCAQAGGCSTPSELFGRFLIVVVFSVCSTGLLLHGQACATSRLVRPGGLRANVRPAAQLGAILALTLGACAVEWGFTRDAPSAYGLLRGLHAAGDSGADFDAASAAAYMLSTLKKEAAALVLLVLMLSSEARELCRPKPRRIALELHDKRKFQSAVVVVYACWAFFFFLFYRLHEAKAFSSVAQANYFAVVSLLTGMPRWADDGEQ